MRTDHLLIPFFAALCLMASTSCEKDMSGKAIRFRAKTRPEASATKTSYSGEESASVERIDWVDGDKIILAMTNNEAANTTHVYDITEISPENHNSNATLVPVGENGLEWGTGTHDFWAAYPSTVTVGDHSFTANIPAAQDVKFASKTTSLVKYNPDMTKAFLVASQQATPSDSGIDLDFEPAVTTFDVTVGANSNFTITQARLVTESDPLSGDAVVTFDPSGGMSRTFSASGSTVQSITVSFKNADGSAERNPAVSTTTEANFKLFALPLNITGASLIFTLGTGAQWRIKLKDSSGNWLTFPAGHKINISGLLVPGAVWYINFEGPREESWVIVPDIEIGVE